MLSRRFSTFVVGATLLAVPAVGSAAVALAPYLPGSTATTSGASASFSQIANDWTGSTVLWNETTKSFGTGDPIGATYGSSWGKGLWGYNDFVVIRSGGVPVINSWSGLANTIHFADDCFNAKWSGSWGGPAALAPLFGSATPGCASEDPNSSAANDQDNWISYFTGYIRITDPGDDYNFSVLFDDGFFLNLYGANGAMYSIGQPYLSPRDRLGFSEDFALDTGLYRFELGAWDHLQAGVVDLSWRRGTGNWSLVPVESVVPVPEPGTLGLLATGFLALMLARRSRRAGPAGRPSHAA